MKANVPRSKYVLFAIGTGIMMLCASPFLHAVANLIQVLR